MHSGVPIPDVIVSLKSQKRLLPREEPLIAAALERLRPRTVRRLIRLAENKFQKMGRPYPEPWPANCDGWSDFSCPLPMPIY
jgi:hypothetical protein